MSKFIDKLNRLQSVSTPMGFGRAHSAPTPKMLLIASLPAGEPKNPAEKAGGADAGLLPFAGRGSVKSIQEAGKACPDIPWGAWLRTHERIDSAALKEAGVDFAIVSPDSPLDTGQDIGRILEVGPDMDEGLLAAVNRISLDAVLVNTGAEKGPLTWRNLMVLRRFADIVSQPTIALVPSELSGDELKALWQAGIDGIVVEGRVKELRELIDSLAFPMPRQRISAGALLPKISALAESEAEAEEGEEEE